MGLQHSRLFNQDLPEQTNRESLEITVTQELTQVRDQKNISESKSYSEYDTINDITAKILELFDQLMPLLETQIQESLELPKGSLDDIPQDCLEFLNKRLNGEDKEWIRAEIGYETLNGVRNGFNKRHLLSIGLVVKSYERFVQKEAENLKYLKTIGDFLNQNRLQ